MSDSLPSDKNDYFDYIASVLGVKSIYLEASPSLSANAETAPGGAPADLKSYIPLLVTVEDLAHYAAEERDLLEKMISALKIDIDKVKVVDAATDISHFDYTFLLNFSNNPRPASGLESVLTTHSPRILLKNPSLKKQVWNEFQTIIKFFSN